MKQVSIVEARDHFTKLVREVEENSGVQITRWGTPVAVMLSMTEFNRLQKSGNNFWDNYLTFRQQFDLDELAVEPEAFEVTING